MTSAAKIRSGILELYNTEGVEACILYRMDGSPLDMELSEDRDDLLKFVSWMEDQVKHVMNEMINKDLSNLVFTFSDKKILFYPSSKSTVLAVVVNSDAHQNLISLEIARVREKIKEEIS